MFLKTTSLNFKTYGTTFSENSPRHIKNRNNIGLEISNKSVNQMYYANNDLYLRVNDGIVALIVTKDLNKAFEVFIVHQVVRLNKGVYYNFVSIVNSSKIEISNVDEFDKSTYPLAKPYIYQQIKPSIRIKEIYSYYYVVRGLDYHFPGEKHTFWEMTIVNSGTLNTIVDNTEYTLKSNEIILYAPNQFHNQSTNSSDSCSYLTIVFDFEQNEDLHKLTNRVFKANQTIHDSIEHFINSSNRKDRYDDDLLINDLTNIIINLLHNKENKMILSTPMQQKFDNELLESILNYIQENIYHPLTIEDICKKFSISRSTVQVLFNNNLKIAPKQYISEQKLKRSKYLIKESKYTISEIASICGFTSIHYFSRRFKMQYGMTPTDYAKSFVK